VLISLARGFNADLFAILFGSILTVTAGDVWLILALGATVTVAIGGFYRQLLAITLNEDLARTSGVPVAALNLLLTVLTALTTVVAMRMVGVLLVSAMIVIPALTGFALGRSFHTATAIAIGMALLSMTGGLIAAYYLRLAAGGAVVLTALLLFAVASLARRRAAPGARPSPRCRSAWSRSRRAPAPSRCG
jgi:zinc transport system permease protein